MRAFLVLLGICLWPCFGAQAADGLLWNWDAPRRYLVVSDVTSPEFIWFLAEFNSEARVSQWRTNFVMNCAGEPIGKKAYEVQCKIEDISIQAKAVSEVDARKLNDVLNDMDTKLTGAVLQMEMTTDGRIRSVDLEGIEKRNRRTRDMVETMRRILSRGVALLDLQLPKKGDDGGSGQWEQKNSLVVGFPYGLGTIGSVRLKHEIAEDASATKLVMTGKGIAGAGVTVQVAGQEQIANLYEMIVGGEAFFDTKTGGLVSRQYQSQGQATASSIQADGWNGVKYMQAARLSLIGEADQPKLGETGGM